MEVFGGIGFFEVQGGLSSRPVVFLRPSPPTPIPVTLPNVRDPEARRAYKPLVLTSQSPLRQSALPRGLPANQTQICGGRFPFLSSFYSPLSSALSSSFSGIELGIDHATVFSVFASFTVPLLLLLLLLFILCVCSSNHEIASVFFSCLITSLS